MILAERYQVIRPLAQGGFGKTFLACDRYLPSNPHCVIKQFSPLHLTPDALDTAHRLFALEARTLYQLGTHSQIPTLLAHFEQDGEFYLVQEYIAGEALAEEFIQHRPASRVQYTQTLLHNLLGILAFVHQHHVVHRDIKPANIIRRSDDQQLVLIDFGAVKALGASMTAQTSGSQSSSSAAPYTISIGSPGYIAPEQQAGRPCFASDLYAVGIVALQAFNGKPPPQQPFDPQTGDVRVAIDPAFPELTAFLSRLVCAQPGDRFPDATAALAALSAFSTETPEKITLSNTPLTALPPQISIETHLSDPDTAQSTNVQLEDTRPVRVELAQVSRSAFTTAADRNRQALLNKVNRFWIEGVLAHSLHGQVLLTLGLEERTQAVALPWNISWETNQQPIRPLDVGTRVFDIFQQMGEGRSLLILGEPGAGKTTTLLTLARDLLAQNLLTQRQTNQDRHHYENQRIPAVFNLSSWIGEPIDQWLISELNSKYQIPKNIGKAWVDEQQLLLLLDGLDEVRRDRQNSCAIALNQFHQNYGPELVVCCRVNDYEALEQRLSLQSAVYVRSLTDQQIWQYLNRAETGLSGLRVLLERSTQRPNASGQTLFDLARSPLMLNIMALTYQGISASQIPALKQGESYTHQLFSAYIERMFQRRDIASPYRRSQTLRWLQSLAIHLTTTSQTVFLIERMQVNWLTSRAQRGLYVLLLFLCFWVVATGIGWQVVSHRVLPLALVIGSLLCARIFGLYRIVPAETLRWSWPKARRSFLLGLTLGPLIGWALKIVFVFAFSPGYCLALPGCFQFVSLIGLSFGIVLGLTYGVIRGLSGARIATVTKPNQGIRQSAKNAILFATVAMIAPWLTSLFFQGSTSSAFWAAAGLSFGLALGGGEACAKHGVLRFVLFCQGRIPWNYARFLDYAAERILLQKVGGGYIFVHRLLLEHFADMAARK